MRKSRPIICNRLRCMALLCWLVVGSQFSLTLAQTQKGKASFYSKRATGSRTANGERLHHDSLTCAHRSYPFGTLLKVTNPSNGKQVIVRVTDRGPFVRGRIIDLSWRAANELGMIAAGIAMVNVELYKPSSGVPFKDDAATQLPEIDFEMANAAYSFKPAWSDSAYTHKKKQLPTKVKKYTENPLSAKQQPEKEPEKKKKEGTLSTIYNRLKQWGKEKLED